MTDFWISAWSVWSVLNGDPPETPPPVAALDDLKQQAIQRYVFEYRQWHDSRWFSAIAASGIFLSPPAVEQVGGGYVRASGWPAMTYLRGIVDERPTDVAAVLEQLTTENWWVLGDGLRTATKLEPQEARIVLLHLLRQLQGAPVSWLHPDVFVDAILALALPVGPDAEVSEGVFRVASLILSTSNAAYDLGSIFRRLIEALPEERRHGLLDGIETTLIDLGRRGSLRYHRYAPDLSLEGASEPLEVLLAAWERVSTAVGGAQALIRAIRLLGLRDDHLQQLGLVALRRSLAASPPDPAAVSVLSDLLADESVIGNFQLEQEYLVLLSENWRRLPTATRAEFLERKAQRPTQSDDREGIRQAYAVRNLLSALRPYIGDREQVLLEELETDLGPADPRGRSGRVGAVWVGPTGPVSSEAASEMDVTELVALMRYVPREPGQIFDVSAEGMGQQIKVEVERRVADFLPILPEIASSVPYAAVIYNVLWGLESAFRDEQLRSSAALGAVLDFAMATLSNADAGRYQGTESVREPGSQVARSVADLLDGLAPWIATSDNPDVVARLASRLLDDSDPTVEMEIEYGGDNMDPPTLGLNVTRGRAVRACLALLGNTWGHDDRNVLRERLEELLMVHVARERSPSVMSAYGVYLAQLNSYWPAFVEARRSDLLPSERPEIWEAVFVTFLMFGPIHIPTAEAFRAEYELAIRRLTDQTFAFLRKNSARLYVHLAVLARSASDEGWRNPLWEATETIEDDAIGSAVHELINAGVFNGAEDLVRGVVTRRLNRRARLGTEFSPQEGRALVDLLTTTGGNITQSGPMLIELLRRKAAFDLDRLVKYLVESDPARGRIGVSVLSAAFADRELIGFMRDEDALLGLVGSYAESVANEVWPLLNRLGELGLFRVEDIAKGVGESLGHVSV